MRDSKRRAKSLESHEVYMPPDLLSQILARLRPKTLMQLRCVCRYWCSLIDDFDFISMHLDLYSNRHAKTQLITVEMARGNSPKILVALRRSDTFRKVAQLLEYSDSYVCPESCLVHGLLLLWSNSDHFTLLNPSIRKSLTLPRCPLKLHKGFGSCSFLGYAHSHKDYKVVAFDCVSSTKLVLGIAIYSLCDRCWREKRIVVPKWCYNSVAQCVPGGSGSVYFHGAVYLRPMQGSGELLSFDFDSEELRYMKLPDFKIGTIISLFLFSGSLAVFGISRVRSCIWVLETNTTTYQWSPYWNHDSSLDAYQFFKGVVAHTSFQVTYVEDTGTLLVKGSSIVAYNIISGEIKCLAKHIPFRFMDFYVESLVLHKGYEGAVSTLGAS